MLCDCILAILVQSQLVEKRVTIVKTIKNAFYNIYNTAAQWINDHLAGSCDL